MRSPEYNANSTATAKLQSSKSVAAKVWQKQLQAEKNLSKITKWIASVQKVVDDEGLVPDAYFEPLFMPDSTPADKDAADVISQMNMLLNEIPSSNDANVDVNGIDFHGSADLGGVENKPLHI